VYDGLPAEISGESNRFHVEVEDRVGFRKKARRFRSFLFAQIKRRSDGKQNY
jgi:hypothetical protein